MNSSLARHPRRTASFCALLAALTLIAALGGSARADNVIPATCATLQADLTAASDNDFVVLDGMCTGQSFSLPSGVAFSLEGAAGTMSGFDGAPTNSSELYGSNVGAVTISGLTFEGQDTAESALSLDETGSGTLTLSNDTFQNNTSTGSGSVNYPVAQVTLSGGGTSCSSAGGGLEISGSQFIDNTSTNAGAAADADGGALAVDVDCGHDPVDLSDDTFQGNVLQAPPSGYSAEGAGLYLDGSDDSLLPSVTQSADLFEGNKVTAAVSAPSAYLGGAGEWAQSVSVRSGRDGFISNTLPGTSGGAYWAWGAGLALYDSYTTDGTSSANTLTDDVLAANEITEGAGATPSEADGAALYIGAGVAGDNRLSLYDSTVTDNSVTPAASGATAGIWGHPADRLALTNSIPYGDQGGSEVDSTGFAAASSGSLSATYSDFCSSGSPYAGAGNICADPKLADDGNPTSGDAEETAASPTVDVGSNALVPLGLVTDYYNNLRELSATGCDYASGTVDIGASEYQPPPCAVPAAPSAPTATAGVHSALVSFTPPADNGSPITSYTVTASPGGAHVSGASSPLTLTSLTPGTAYTFTVTATNALGTGPPSPPSTSVMTLALPGLSQLKASVISFFAARGGGPTTTKKGVGTTFTYRDSEAATSTLAFFRVISGIKHRGACVAPRPGLTGKTCARRYVASGAFTHVDVAGKNKVHFSGRLDGHALSPGLYQVRITPTIDGVAGTAVKTEFDVF
jgi:hypothetical protein